MEASLSWLAGGRVLKWLLIKTLFPCTSPVCTVQPTLTLQMYSGLSVMIKEWYGCVMLYIAIQTFLLFSLLTCFERAHLFPTLSHRGLRCANNQEQSDIFSKVAQIGRMMFWVPRNLCIIRSRLWSWIGPFGTIRPTLPPQTHFLLPVRPTNRFQKHHSQWETTENLEPFWSINIQTPTSFKYFCKTSIFVCSVYVGVCESMCECALAGAWGIFSVIVCVFL